MLFLYILVGLAALAILLTLPWGQVLLLIGIALLAVAGIGLLVLHLLPVVLAMVIIGICDSWPESGYVIAALVALFTLIYAINTERKINLIVWIVFAGGAALADLVLPPDGRIWGSTIAVVGFFYFVWLFRPRPVEAPRPVDVPFEETLANIRKIIREQETGVPVAKGHQASNQAQNPERREPHF